MITVFAHPTTVRYYDYHDLLETEHGLSWSSSGKSEDAAGYTRCDFSATLVAKRASIDPTVIDVQVGEPVTRTHNMNPHGLV